MLMFLQHSITRNSMSLSTPQTLHFHSVRASERRQDTGRWSVAQVQDLFELPLPELLFRAQTVHREQTMTRRVSNWRRCCADSNLPDPLLAGAQFAHDCSQ